MLRKNQKLSSNFALRYHMPSSYKNPILASMVDLLRPYRNKVILSAEDGVAYKVNAYCTREEFIGEFINQEGGEDITIECYYIETDWAGEPVYDIYRNDQTIGEDLTSDEVYRAFSKLVDPILGLGILEMDSSIY